MKRHVFIEGIAVAAAVAAGAGTAAGIVRLMQGDRRGAPGVTSALSRVGRTTGGGMIAGIALSAGCGTLAGLALHASLQALERRYA